MTTNLELVSSSELIAELSNRYSDIIVISENIKIRKVENVHIKTRRGKKGRTDKNYDLVIATSMLQAAQSQLIYEYLDEVE